MCITDEVIVEWEPLIIATRECREIELRQCIMLSEDSRTLNVDAATSRGTGSVGFNSSRILADNV